jgi:hypothetical protein
LSVASQTDVDTDPSIIDFNYLGERLFYNQKTLIPPPNGETLSTFFRGGPENGPDPDINTWYGYAKSFGFVIQIQFIGVASTALAHITTANESETGGLTELADPSSPPMVDWSDRLSVTFYLPRPPSLTDVMMVNRDQPTPVQPGGVLSLPLRSAVTPMTIRITDSVGTTFIGNVEWLGMAQWGLPLPAGVPNGNATIVRITSPFEILWGAGKPWANVVTMPQFP